MFGIVSRPLKWSVLSSSFLTGISLILFFVSAILSHTREEFPLWQMTALLSLFNSLILINEIRINRQLSKLQIQIHKFSKIYGIIYIILMELWMISILWPPNYSYYFRSLLPISIWLLAMMVISVFHPLVRDDLIFNQYNLGIGWLRNYIDEERLSVSPEKVSANIFFRKAWPTKGIAQIDWKMENGKNVTWHLQLRNSAVISFLSNLFKQSQITIVNGIPVYIELENTHVSDKIREIVRSA